MIGALFRPRHFLDADLEGWSLETWAWLMRNLGGMAHLAQTPLATPSRTFFPPTEATGDARVRHIFDCVRASMGRLEWPCDLQAFHSRDTQQVSEFVFVQGSRKPLGTFEYNADGDVVIRYAANLADQPGALVATLAHELAHYIVSRVEEPLPGGPEANELVTELTVAYAGFGVFAIANAVAFHGHGDTFSQGWRVSGGGYLSQRTWAFALALFLFLKGDPPEGVSPWLANDLSKMTRRAYQHLQRNPALTEPLRAIA